MPHRAVATPRLSRDMATRPVAMRNEARHKRHHEHEEDGSRPEQGCAALLLLSFGSEGPLLRNKDRQILLSCASKRLDRRVVL